MTPTSQADFSQGDDRANLRTRIADRTNALIWRLPVPRRIQVFLSQLVYRNPPLGCERAVEALGALDDAGVETVLIGGWGVDALVGEQLRRHGDLDLLTDESQIEPAISTLRRLGFKPWNHDADPGPIGDLQLTSAQTFRDRALRVVELHTTDLRMVNRAEGSVGGRSVSCLPADHQLQAQHQMGRTLTPQRRNNQRRNLQALHGAMQHNVKSA